MHLKAFIVAQLAVFTVLAAPSNPTTSEPFFDALQQPAERDIQRRAWSFYAGGGGCLTGWSGQCNYYCKDNIRTEAEYHSLRVNGWNNVVVLDKREMVANYERLIFELIEEKY
ncbi:hypothetical protein QBC42DRAFT_254521 [Cladorrhinum samala]|uniref:Uncharacterized protein n=1 Tax=Cladorrhinum samala TaxID=585594 RepID=A0AAV9HFP9_9PEZI|nr:hypothetical protein QBC42DRAFT_254521 [Cladorrhinum samala]